MGPPFVDSFWWMLAEATLKPVRSAAETGREKGARDYRPAA
jgi:hypothetical protein